TAEFWEYDPRSIRRWNVDPKPNISLSPYNCFTGNPIAFSDEKGDTIKISYRDKKTGVSGEYIYGSKDKLPKDKLLRQTARTLDKIVKKGADPLGVIDFLSSNQKNIIISPSS